jgi:ankyrin repeat protein
MTTRRIAYTLGPMVFPLELWDMIVEVASTAALYSLSPTSRLFYYLCRIQLAKHGAKYSMDWTCHRKESEERIDEPCEHCDCPDRMPVLFAIRKGRAELLKRFLVHGYSANYKFVHCRHGSFSALHEAVTIPYSKSKAKIVQMLLYYGADVDCESDWDVTPMVYGASHGMDWRTAQLLLDHKASVNKQRDAALSAACYGQNFELAQFFLQKRANVNHKDPEYHLTPLHQVLLGDVGKNTEHIIDLLLQNGASPHDYMATGITPLHFAIFSIKWDKISKGLRARVVKMMLEAPLGNGKLPKWPPPRGSDVYGASAQNNRHFQSPLLHNAFIIQEVGECPRVIDLLIAHATMEELNQKNALGYTVMQLAAMYGDTIVLETLIKRGADINIVDFNNLTALHLAANRHRIKIIEKLVSVEGVNINAVDNFGRTALHLVFGDFIVFDLPYDPWPQTYKDKPSSVVALLVGVLKMDVNAKDNNGSTALDLAIKQRKKLESRGKEPMQWRGSPCYCGYDDLVKSIQVLEYYGGKTNNEAWWCCSP